MCVCLVTCLIQRGNLIQAIENLQTLWALQVLDLACNRIQSLSGLQNLHLLGSVNLENNRVQLNPSPLLLLKQVVNNSDFQSSG